MLLTLVLWNIYSGDWSKISPLGYNEEYFMLKMANLSLAVFFLMLITTVSVLNQMLLIIVKKSNSFFEHSRDKGKRFGNLSKSINVSSSLIIFSYYPLKLGYLVSVFSSSKTTMSFHYYVT